MDSRHDVTGALKAASEHLCPFINAAELAICCLVSRFKRQHSPHINISLIVLVPPSLSGSPVNLAAKVIKASRTRFDLRAH